MNNFFKLFALGAFAGSVYANQADKLAWPDYVEGQFVVKAKGSASLSSLLSSGSVRLKQSVNSKEGVMLVERNESQAIKSLGLDSRVSSRGLDRAIQKAMIRSQKFQYVEPNFIYKLAQHTRNGFVDALKLASQTPAEPIPGTVVPNDPMFPQLWGLQNLGQKDSEGTDGVSGADIDATTAWTMGTGSKDVVVAVIDTGIDYTHPDLVDNMWSAPHPDPAIGGTIHGFNAINNTFDPMDDNDHGSHCAGTIGGVANNGQGVAGVAWNVSLMGVKFLSGGGSGTLADAVKAIDFATEQNVDVMSNSWGGGGFSEALLESIQRANEKGIVFVAAAGNESSNNDDSPSYPASYQVDNVVSVAATTNVDGLASFSSYGKRSVHVGAPGHNILSSTPGNTYQSFSGTSMATPHVSGAVALFKSLRGSAMAPVQIRQELMLTSDRLPSLKKQVAMGGSRLNLSNLISNVVVPGPVVVPADGWSEMVANLVESEHPYKDSFTAEWRITVEGAKYLRLHFSQFDTEPRYDSLTIKNAATGEILETLSGTLGAFVTEQIDANDLILSFKSDSSVNKTGFVLDGYSTSNYEPAPVVASR